MSDPVDDFLVHYGVKGMKWGERKRLYKAADAHFRTNIIPEAQASLKLPDRE